MSPEPVVPDEIGHYRVERVIGAGGMGVVYRARDNRLDRPVAIKAIAERLLANSNAIERLRREARSAAQLDHPYVCRVYELVESGSDVYIVMEYVEGETLRERLKRGALPFTEAIRLSAEIAEGLADAHAHGMVHRDVKPGNIIITPHGHVKILDFGLAHRDMSSSAEALTETGQRTSVGAGTPHYMAPEQVTGRPITARADVYAIGVVLFECLTGKLPFDDDSEIDAALMRVAPPEVAEMVARCLERNPAARFEHAGAVAAELRSLTPTSTGLGSVAPVARPWWRRRDAIIAVVAATFAIAAAVWSVTRSPVLGATFTLEHFDAEPSAEFGSRISPDGKRVSFMSNRLGSSQLFVKDAAGDNATHVDTGASEVLSHVWSPDGSEYAVIVRRSGSYRGVLQLFRSTSGGSPRLTIELDTELSSFRALRWVKNAVFLEASATGQVLLLRVPLDEGELPTRISAAWKLPGRLENLDVNHAGDKAVLAVNVAGQDDLFVIGLAPGSAASALTHDAFFQRQPLWSGPNTVVFRSNQSGESDLWEMDLQSKTSAPVVIGPAEETPESALADGSVITLKQFSVSADLWAIAEPGQASRELTAGALGSFAPSLSADGRVIAFQRLQPEADRGDPLEGSQIAVGPLVSSGLLTTTRLDTGGLPVLSPDGSWLACLQRTGRTTFQLLARSVTGTKAETVSTKPQVASYTAGRLDWVTHPFSWSPDGRTLYFVEGSSELRAYLVGSGRPSELLTTLTGELVRDPIASPDGLSLAFLSQKGTAYRLHVLNLASREDAVLVVNPGYNSDTFNRGWTKGGGSVVLVRAPARGRTAEIILADPQAAKVVASISGVFPQTAFFDAFRDAVYFTQELPTGHRVVSLSVRTGELRELKQTSNPRVTFSGLASAAGGPIVGVQDERRTDVWLAHRRMR